MGNEVLVVAAELQLFVIEVVLRSRSVDHSLLAASHGNPVGQRLQVSSPSQVLGRLVYIGWR